LQHRQRDKFKAYFGSIAVSVNVSISNLELVAMDSPMLAGISTRNIFSYTPPLKPLYQQTFHPNWTIRLKTTLFSPNTGEQIGCPDGGGSDAVHKS
jgi:hypothetical protein